MESRTKRSTTQIAKQFLAENTPTLLQKIKAFNSPEEITYIKSFKSFSEHHKGFKTSKMHINSHQIPAFDFVTDRLNKKEAQSPRFDHSKNFFESSLVGNSENSKESWLNMQTMRKNRQLLKGFGMSVFHSSSTMQQSVPSVTFPKASRFFSNDQNNPLKMMTSPNELHKILHPITKATTGVGETCGFGNRVLIPSHLHKKDMLNPAPNKYEVIDNIKKTEKGKSFGMPFKAYSKVYLEYSKQPEVDNPGPGYYLKEKKKLKNKMIKDLWARICPLEPLKEKGEVILSPNYYSPKTDIVNSGRYKSISFGTENRNL